MVVSTRAKGNKITHSFNVEHTYSGVGDELEGSCYGNLEFGDNNDVEFDYKFNQMFVENNNTPIKKYHSRFIQLEYPVRGNTAHHFGDFVMESTKNRSLPTRWEYLKDDLNVLVGSSMSDIVNPHSLYGRVLYEIKKVLNIQYVLEKIELKDSNFEDELTWEIIIEDRFYCFCGYDFIYHRYWITPIKVLDRPSAEENIIQWQIPYDVGETRYRTKDKYLISVWELNVIVWCLYILNTLDEEYKFKKLLKSE